MEEPCECAPPTIQGPEAVYKLFDASDNEFQCTPNQIDSMEVWLIAEQNSNNQVDSIEYYDAHFSLNDQNSPEAHVYMGELINYYNESTDLSLRFKTPLGTSARINLFINSWNTECCSYHQVDYLIGENNDTIYDYYSFFQNGYVIPVTLH